MVLAWKCARITALVIVGVGIPFLFSACGGSSGGSSSGSGTGDAAEETQTEPFVNAGENQTIEAGKEVLLQATTSGFGEDAITYQWEQTAGDEFAFNPTDAATVTFTAPKETLI